MDEVVPGAVPKFIHLRGGGRCTLRLVTSPVVEDLLQSSGELTLTYFALNYLVCRSRGYLNEMRCHCI